MRYLCTASGNLRENGILYSLLFFSVSILFFLTPWLFWHLCSWWTLLCPHRKLGSDCSYDRDWHPGCEQSRDPRNNSQQHSPEDMDISTWKRKWTNLWIPLPQLQQESEPRTRKPPRSCPACLQRAQRYQQSSRGFHWRHLYWIFEILESTKFEKWRFVPINLSSGENYQILACLTLWLSVDSRTVTIRYLRVFWSGHPLVAKLYPWDSVPRWQSRWMRWSPEYWLPWCSECRHSASGRSSSSPGWSQWWPRR